MAVAVFGAAMTGGVAEGEEGTKHGVQTSVTDGGARRGGQLGGISCSEGGGIDCRFGVCSNNNNNTDLAVGN